ncbi:MAG: PDZ domain-containing protein, partial [Saprospiraceae bacterium]|nr:PDZ domain-containing protein [Pyrinomonadaceae bacterium]
MTKNKGIRLIVLLFCVAPVFSQIGSRISPPEPFRIAPGSSFSAAGGMSNAGTSRATVAADFQDALNIIAQYHVGGRSLNSDSLTKSSIDSMLRILDPHSNYLDAAEFTELLGEHESEYSGTGSSISGFSRNGLVETYIVSTFPGSPAFKAGLRYGDRIVAVNGEKIAGKASDIVRDKVRGKRGSVVSMTIERADTAAVETISLRRERVSQPTIPNAYALNNTTGYIDLSAGFSYTTSSEM